MGTATAVSRIVDRVIDRANERTIEPVIDRTIDRGVDRVPARTDVYARPDVYDMEYAGAENEDARFLARLLVRIRPRRVLELACGSGRVTLTLAATLPSAEIVGVDSSIEMLDRAAAALDAAAPPCARA